MFRIALLIFAFSIVFVSCKRALPHEELLAYLNNPENGLVQEKQISGVKLDLRYKPYDLYLEQHLQSIPDSLREKERSGLAQMYKDNLYLQLSLGYNGQEIISSFVNTPMHTAMVNRLAFGMREFVVLTTENRDTLLLKDFTYIPTYGLAQNNKILFVFENKNTEDSDYLKFQLKEMGLNTGQVNFKIKSKDIKTTPSLKF